MTNVKMVIVVTGGSIERAERIARAAEGEAEKIAAERKRLGQLVANNPQVTVLS